MNALLLALASIRSRPLNSGLSLLAAAAGIALVCATLLLSQAVADGFQRNAEGIDIVAGAKGSPLQLVLSTVYHADVPAANIDMADYRALAHNRHIRQAIPLALGDNYRGWRMVGTTPAYPALYGAELADGHMFTQPFETVVGAVTGLKMGEKFAVSHGFSADSDDVHDFQLYTVVGVLKPTGTVLDRLLLTTVESVQQLHAHHEEHAPGEPPDPDEAQELAMAHQVTAVLLKVRGAMDLINLPHQLNAESNIMAAVPSYVMARLTANLGIGRRVLLMLGAGFVGLAMLILLSAMAASLAARRYDLAVLRVLGAAPATLAATVIAEGLMIGLGGAVIGLLAGHMLAWALILGTGALKGVVLPASLLAPGPLDAMLLLAGLLGGMLAALLPAVLAARTDIARLLVSGRG